MFEDINNIDDLHVVIAELYTNAKIDTLDTYMKREDRKNFIYKILKKKEKDWYGDIQNPTSRGNIVVDSLLEEIDGSGR